ncbi:MAG TPA: hypothetical protein VJN96_01090 [Vicinamibacterales bacterium]|nr:hypothetical protein [Vicinamibacterales bacterium]
MVRSVALRVRAWIALATFAASLTLPFLAARHLTFDDDAACGIETLVLAHPRVQFEAPQPGPQVGHCALCHWVRAVSGARPGPEVHVNARLDALITRIAPVLQGHGASVQTARASRAPPVALL